MRRNNPIGEAVMYDDLMSTRLSRLPHSGMPLHSIIAVRLRASWRSGATVFFAVVVLGLLVALLMPARYRSEARLLALTADYYDVRADNSDSSRADPIKAEDVVNLEMQLLSSHDLQRAALIRLDGAEPDPAVLEKARENFTDNLQITKAADASVIELAFIDQDPVRAAAALNNILASYFAMRARVLTSGRVAALEEQRQAAAAELDRLSVQLRDYQAKHQIADIAAQTAGAVAIDTALRQERSETLADLSSERESLARLRKSASNVPNSIEIFRDDTEATRAITEMETQMVQLQARRADLAGRYMAGSPLLIQIDNQIDSLRSAISQQNSVLRQAHRVGRNSDYDTAVSQVRQADAAASGAAARKARLDQEIGNSVGRLQSLNVIGSRIAEMEIQRDAARARYRAISDQVDSARASETQAMTGTTNVRIIQQPNVPIKRDNSLILLIAGSIFAGIVLGSATIFIRTIGRATHDDGDETCRVQG